MWISYPPIPCFKYLIYLFLLEQQRIPRVINIQISGCTRLYPHFIKYVYSGHAAYNPLFHQFTGLITIPMTTNFLSLEEKLKKVEDQVIWILPYQLPLSFSAYQNIEFSNMVLSHCQMVHRLLTQTMKWKEEG